jgi:SynChlorMet cassette radical SAM/SPASM protein ScmE
VIKRGELSAPISVFLDITNRCNLRCRHCSASAGAPLDDELTTDEWLTLIRRLAELKVFKVTVTGGEPLIRPDVFELLGELDRYGIVIRLNTNATLVDDGVAGRLADLRMLKSVSVSLDGSSASIHEQLRGKGAFDQAVRGIQVLVRRGLNVHVGAVVTRTNMSDLEGMVRLAQKLGMSSVGFTSLHPAGRLTTNKSSLWLSADERQQVARCLTGLRGQYEGFVGASHCSWHELLSAPPEPGEQPRRIHICGAAQEACAIRANGDVVPCNAASDYRCGNIREEDLVTIWRDSPRMRAVRTLSNLTADDVEGCRDCPYRFSCTTGCRANAWSLTGSWTGGPGAVCWYYPD